MPHQVIELLTQRDKESTTLLMAAVESGNKDTFEAALGAIRDLAIGEV